MKPATRRRGRVIYVRPAWMKCVLGQPKPIERLSQTLNCSNENSLPVNICAIPIKIPSWMKHVSPCKGKTVNYKNIYCFML